MRYLIGFICILFIPLSASADVLDQAFKDFAAGKYEEALPALEEAAASNADAAFAAGIAHFRISGRLRDQGKNTAASIAQSYSYLEVAETARYPAARSALFELDYTEGELTPAGSPERDVATRKVQAGIDRLAGVSIDQYTSYDAIVYMRTPEEYFSKPDAGNVDYAANHAIETASGPLTDWYKAEALTAWGNYYLIQTKGIDGSVKPYLVNPYKERAYFAFQGAVQLTGSLEAKRALDRLTADGWDPIKPQDYNTASAQPIPERSGPAAEGLQAFDLGNYLYARKLLKEPADQGNPDAAFAMYFMIDNGLGRSSRDQDGGYDRRHEVANDYFAKALAGGSPEIKIALADSLRERAKALLGQGRNRNDKDVKDMEEASYVYMEEGWNNDLPYASRVRVKLTYNDDPIYSEQLLGYYNFDGKSTFMRWDRSQNLTQLGLHITDGNGTGKYGLEFQRLYLKMAMSRMKRAVAISRNPDAYGYLGLVFNSLSDDPADKAQALHYFLEGAKAGDRLSHDEAIDVLLVMARQGEADRMKQAYALSRVAGEIWPVDDAKTQGPLSGLDSAEADAARRYADEKAAAWRKGDYSIFEEIQQTL